MKLKNLNLIFVTFRLSHHSLTTLYIFCISINENIYIKED